MELGTTASEKTLHIQMLGSFTLCYGEKSLSGDKGKSKQVWNLLEYLLIYRKKEISPEKLMDALWEDEVDNPANALKNLVYRLRAMLKENLGIEKQEYIIFNHGTYAWNNAAPFTLDIDKFEAAWKIAQQPELVIAEKCQHYLEVVSLYKGDFLTHSSYKEWVIPLAVYYQSIYMECVEALSMLLLQQEDYNKCIEICLNAIAIDPLIEKNHELLILALLGAKSNNKALIQYDYVTELFYKEVGVKPSDAITRLYEIIVNKDHNGEKNIELVQTDLREEGQEVGAVCCDYEAFKLVYRINARAAIRSGKSVFIALLSFSKPNGIDFKAKELSETMEKIKEIIKLALRKDDLLSRFSRTQYVVLLSNINFENTEVVLNKLLVKISKACSSKKIMVTGHVQPLEPIELKQTNQQYFGGA
ncbi:MAG: BTAD domain-containing putative transcriptional regulator [Clostridia bacterium]